MKTYLLVEINDNLCACPGHVERSCSRTDRLQAFMETSELHKAQKIAASNKSLTSFKSWPVVESTVDANRVYTAEDLDSLNWLI